MTTDQARDFAPRIDDDIAAEVETGLQGDFLDVPSRIDVRIGKAARDTRNGRLMIRLERLDASDPGTTSLAPPPNPMYGWGMTPPRAISSPPHRSSGSGGSAYPAGYSQIDEVFVRMVLLDVEVVDDCRAELSFELGTNHRTMRRARRVF